MVQHLIRASAKNYNSVTTICSSKYYKSLEKNMKKNSGFTDLNYRKKMAEKTFRITSEYDKEIFISGSQKIKTKRY